MRTFYILHWVFGTLAQLSIGPCLKLWCYSQVARSGGPAFTASPSHMRLAVDKVALCGGFLQAFRFLSPFTCPPSMLYSLCNWQQQQAIHILNAGTEMVS